MRKCSHKLLPEDDRNVAIYYHVSTVPEYTIMNADDKKSTEDRRTFKVNDKKLKKTKFRFKNCNASI